MIVADASAVAIAAADDDLDGSQSRARLRGKPPGALPEIADQKGGAGPVAADQSRRRRRAEPV